jgi:hypothetical protein
MKSPEAKRRHVRMVSWRSWRSWRLIPCCEGMNRQARQGRQEDPGPPVSPERNAEAEAAVGRVPSPGVLHSVPLWLCEKRRSGQSARFGRENADEVFFSRRHGDTEKAEEGSGFRLGDRQSGRESGKWKFENAYPYSKVCAGWRCRRQPKRPATHESPPTRLPPVRAETCAAKSVAHRTGVPARGAAGCPRRGGPGGSVRDRVAGKARRPALDSCPRRAAATPPPARYRT